MKITTRIGCFVCILVLCVFLLPIRSYAAEGALAEGIIWRLEDGTLTISGNGVIPWSFDTPWSDMKDTIHTVVVEPGITETCASLFSGLEKLTSVSLPDTLETLGRSAFENCTALTSVTLPDSLKTIGETAFMNCTSLSSVYIPPSVVTIGCGAFANCASLTSITIPPSIRTVEAGAFSKCTALKSVYISDLLAWCYIDFGFDTANPLYYGADLYLQDQLVTELVIPEEILMIKEAAFSGCGSIQSVTIPEGVKAIQKYSFRGCPNLVSVTLPGSMQAIMHMAFKNCYSLEHVTFDGPFRQLQKLVIHSDNVALTSAQWQLSIRYIIRLIFVVLIIGILLQLPVAFLIFYLIRKRIRRRRGY